MIVAVGANSHYWTAVAAAEDGGCGTLRISIDYALSDSNKWAAALKTCGDKDDSRGRLTFVNVSKC